MQLTVTEPNKVVACAIANGSVSLCISNLLKGESESNLAGQGFVLLMSKEAPTNWLHK